MLSLPATATAEERPPPLPFPLPAGTTPEESLRAAGIVLLPGAPPELAAELAAALEALPPGLTPPPGGALELAYHPEPRPFGMGDGSDGAPEWSDGLRRFHLHPVAPSQERRATYRLERLDSEQHRRLWLRRALVHALVRRFDDEQGWSERRAFRRLNGWLAPLGRPLAFSEQPSVSYDWAFSRLRGRDSAALDLATFAEEALVPVESLAPAALAVDDAVRCQEFSKSRFLRERLRELPGAGPGDPLPGSECPAFDAWADPATLSHLEVLFADASSSHPESIFGHLLLLPVRRQGALVEPAGLQPAVQLAAVTGPVEGMISYLYRGSTGGFETAISAIAMGDVLKQNLEVDQRTLRRFRLHLPREQATRVLERAWELERRGYFPYFFFTDNCARALIFLLEGALDEAQAIEIPGTFWVMPAAALDAIARVKLQETQPDGTLREASLLTHVPEDLESSRDVAARADVERERLLEQLGAALPPDGAARLRSLHDATVAPDPVAREAAYRELPGALEPLLPWIRGRAGRERRAWLARWLACTVRLARYAADRGEGRRLSIEAAAVLAPDDGSLPTAAELLVERQRAFEREDLLARTRVLTARQASITAVMERAPRRPLSEGALAELADARANVAAFTTLTDVQAQLVSTLFADESGAAAEAEERQLRIAVQAARDARSLPDSGYGRVQVGAGVARSRGELVPSLVLRSAVLSEQLGDLRQRGLYPGSGLSLVETELRFMPRAGLPQLLGFDFTGLGLKTLSRPLPHERTGLLDHLGWSAELGGDQRPQRDLPFRGFLHGGFLLLLDDGPDHERFTVLGAGAQGQLRRSETVAVAALGPRLELQNRTPLPGAGVNAIRLSARWLPAFAYPARAGLLGHEGRAELSLELLVGRPGGRAVLLGPRAFAEWERGGAASRERFEGNAGLFAELQ